MPTIKKAKGIGVNPVGDKVFELTEIVTLNLSLLIGYGKNFSHPVEIVQVKLPQARIVGTVPRNGKLKFSRFVEKGEGVTVLRWGNRVNGFGKF